MRVKLTVVHTESGSEPRSYVLDQDTIVIGRAGTCDLPLDDPDRVVSKQHAELRAEGDALRAVDLGSKNHTFVNGERVGRNGLMVRDGDSLTMGPFQVAVQIERDVMVADDLDRTVFGAAFNPVGEEAEALASALGDLRRAFSDLSLTDRADALRLALQGALGPGPDAEVLAGLVSPADPMSPLVPPSAPDPLDAPPPIDPPPGWPDAPPPPAGSGVPADPFGSGTPPADPFDLGTPLDDADDIFGGPVPTPAPSMPVADDGEPDDLHRALAAVVVRLISIPGKFRHEFLGHTVIHAPETAFLFDADEAALLRHLTTDDPIVRAERLTLLADAAEAVLQHHQSLLEGYRAAAKEGAAVLLNGLDPDVIGDQAKGGGLLQGKERAVLDLVRERCAMMRAEDFAAAERRVYRPIFSRAYLDTLAHARAASSSDS